MTWLGIIVFYVLVWIIPCMIIASAKNKSVSNAFFGSLLFGVFALIYYIFAKSESERHLCAHCKAKVLRSEKFCPSCGKTLNWDIKTCPFCGRGNEPDAAFCSDCGSSLSEKLFSCSFCDKKFKSKKKAEVHEKTCSARKEDNQSLITVGVVVGILILFVILGTKPSFVIPLLLIGVLFLPKTRRFAEKLLLKRKSRFTFDWRTKVIFTILILLIYVVTIALIPTCPKSCNDGDACTVDFCSKDTGFDCMHIVKLNCVGNGICESGEYGSADCPNCDDGNGCTADYYDAQSGECIHDTIAGC